jgi:hypothetical protein
VGRCQVAGQPFADRLVVAAQPTVEAAAAIHRQPLVQRGEAGGMRNRHQEVPPDQPNQTLDLAFVGALAGPTEAVSEQAM